jgi:hypothetical protein
MFTAADASRGTRRPELSGRAAAGGLLAAGGLHVAWGLGSSWPLPDRARLSETVLGLAGRTDLVSPISTGQEFRRLDRRIYAPVCLGLAALSALSLLPGSRQRVVVADDVTPQVGTQP